MILSDAKYDGKTEIRNIIFDWGGVITDLDFEASKKRFHDLGLTIFDERVPHDPLDKIFIPLEIGRITPDDFRNEIRKLSPQILSDSMIDGAWNAMLGTLPRERWELLESTRYVYRTFLLSNTNAIHLHYYFNYLHGIYGTYGYVHLFEKAYFSFELHLRKPNREIFEYVMKDKCLIPEETLLIDDSEENIETAMNLGLQVIHLKKPLTLVDLFKKIPVKPGKAGK
jgi:putative hydrolase of the HAD superfamily